MTPTRGDPLQHLAAALERLAERLEVVELRGGIGASSDGDRLVRHMRRYLPFYALGLVFALLVLILPAKSPGDGPTAARELTPQTSTDDGAVDAAVAGAPSVPDDADDGNPGAVVSGPEPTETAASGSSVAAKTALDPLAWTNVGKTIANFGCKKGVRQIPWSSYAVPCFPKWTGDNGGATSRGVTSKEIIIVNREFPESADQRAVDAIVQGAGVASAEVTRAARNEFLTYFNKVFELWGRKVKIVDWESQFGNATDEQLGGGKEGACADANIIANEIKAFGVVAGSGPFSECAAERKLVVFGAASYFPETFYDKYHPYLWHMVTECERVFAMAAEYIGKRLHGKPARWAKALEKNKARKFAMYVPTNDSYQSCANIFEKEYAKYGGKLAAKFNYSLDIARVADESARAITQFKAAGATDIILSCDAISPIFLTQNAKGQSYYPEWVLIGVALTDLDIAPRVYDQDEVRGSLFGMSQLGANEKLFGRNGEMPRTYKAATGVDIAEGTDGNYFTYMPIFNFLQATGPALTPQNMARAIYRLPPSGAPGFAAGLWTWRDGPTGRAGETDHTGIDDSREIYYDAHRTGYDGKKGSYVETYGGKRFVTGKWPREDPPIYR